MKKLRSDTSQGVTDPMHARCSYLPLDRQSFTHAAVNRIGNELILFFVEQGDASSKIYMSV